MVAGLALLMACNSQPAANEVHQQEPLPAALASGTGLNTLSEEEKAEGWQLLFDGKSTEGWHSYLKEQIEGWGVKDGMLTTPGGQGDIVTDNEYEHFELSLEWQIETQGNSGIFYYVVEKPEYPRMYETGPEFQIIDDENYPQALLESQKTGANSDVKAPSVLAAKAPGEWNHTRILVNRGHVEHWLNGQKVVEYDLHSPAWKALVAKSKFADMDYAKVHKGRIGLQDHGGPVAYRNIKIREL